MRPNRFNIRHTADAILWDHAGEAQDLPMGAFTEVQVQQLAQLAIRQIIVDALLIGHGLLPADSTAVQMRVYERLDHTFPLPAEG